MSIICGRINHTRPTQQGDAGRASVQQAFGAGVRRGTTGIDVIDKYN